MGAALRRAGHEPVVAASNLVHAAAVLGDLEWLQAPLVTAAIPEQPPLTSTEVLIRLGLAQAEPLAAALRAWQALLALETPAVVVGDYAPVALLAARTARIPRVNIGSGFSLPPRADPMPALRDWMAMDEAQLRRIDGQLLAAVNAALHAVGSPPIATASGIFDSDLELLCTFPEIDPFGPRATAEYFGSLDDSTSGTDLAWEHPGTHVVAYLKPRYALFSTLVGALASLPAEVIVAVPGLHEESAAMLSTGRMRVVAGAVNLSKLLPEADLCIGHGGAGFTACVLAAGVAQGMLVMQLEQFLIGRRVEALGAGAMVIPEKPVADLGAWLRALLDNAPMREAARRAAQSLAGHDAQASADRAAARIASLLGA